MKSMELGDLVGTGNNPAVDALVDKMLGRKIEPKTILVETPGNVYQWGKPILVGDTGNMVEAPKVA